MVNTMMLAMSIDCMATHMQIGLEVSQIGKSHQVDAFFEVCYDFMV